nr:YjcZ family sporulation protein [Bacillus kexueae]
MHCCGYGYPSYPAYGYNRTFVLIVVLFILLIIVGTAFVGNC